jgi:hypothetical protein
MLASLSSLLLSAPAPAANAGSQQIETPAVIDNATGCNVGTCLHIESYGGSGTDVPQIKVYSK